MPVNEFHAFARGVTLPHPSALESAEPSPEFIALAAKTWRSFLSGARISWRALLGVNAYLHNGSGNKTRVSIGEGTCIRGVLHLGTPNGRIFIGDYSYIGDDTIISAREQVVLGHHVLIAHGVQIFDNISHPTDWEARAAHYRSMIDGPAYDPDIRSAPVVIGDHAWIGMSSIIMPGVTIGARAIVAAGSVVVHDVPPDSLVAGNPAVRKTAHQKI